MSNLRSIAFYLPQFHPTHENDEWWGRGFTEWRNVTKVKPLFPGHYQPHLPADLGFYDLRLPEAREAQAALAREYGIHGFCYYHYWFNGRRILERPFNEVLESGKPDLPFCLCWANENWTRVWDGGEKNVLLAQNYNDDDDQAHIQELIPAFRDPRYIRVNGKPLFLVYRTELLPNPRRTADIWRKAAIDAGIGDLYLVRVESFSRGIEPSVHGFDAAVEFAPDGHDVGVWRFHHGFPGWLSRVGVIPSVYSANRVVNYHRLARGMASRPASTYKKFRCVTPMWDNSARRKQDARIVVDSTPSEYEDWLRKVSKQTVSRLEGDEQIVFINAWNEWAEGNHLEPDLKWGHAYLEATRRAMQAASLSAAGNAEPTDAPEVKSQGASSGILKRLWWRLTAVWKTTKELASLVVWNLRRVD